MDNFIEVLDHFRNITEEYWDIHQQWMEDNSIMSYTQDLPTEEVIDRIYTILDEFYDCVKKSRTSKHIRGMKFLKPLLRPNASWNTELCTYYTDITQESVRFRDISIITHKNSFFNLLKLLKIVLVNLEENASKPIKEIQNSQGCTVSNQESCVMRKREIYYRLKDEIDVGSGTIDDLIYTLGLVLGVKRKALKIASSSKGMIWGDFNGMEMHTGVGVMIPSMEGEEIEVWSGADFILVIEKETIFNRIISIPNLCDEIGANVLVMTGRGNPDYSTRRLLNILSREKGIPAFFLCDLNIYGMEIFMNYAYGCISSLCDTQDLATPCLFWLGPFIEDIKNIIPNEDPLCSQGNESKSTSASFNEFLPADEWDTDLLKNIKFSNVGKDKEKIKTIKKRAVLCQKPSDTPELSFSQSSFPDYHSYNLSCMTTQLSHLTKSKLDLDLLLELPSFFTTYTKSKILQISHNLQ
ncbi:unnamed protein product [Moneuplotes crassus]|uniref:Topoisomerase 6 subunit A/Spo11 TOPRIM domain-containing protein n=1 Tax=Euplotes crassus TaxID=5936 RepID=A0AAD1UAS8_EUPCR|nr:unnamed protein product [Moneuplotes crassus]